MKFQWVGRVIVAVALVGLVSAAASAQVPVRLNATLTGGEETPTPVVTGSFGNAFFSVNLAKGEITYTVNVFNLPSGATASHIHVGSKGVTGPIILPLNITPNVSNDFSFSGTLTTGDLIPRPDQGIRSFEDALQAVAAGNVYVNVHTVNNPGGEIRGQLVPEPPKP